MGSSLASVDIYTVQVVVDMYLRYCSGSVTCVPTARSAQREPPGLVLEAGGLQLSRQPCLES